MGSLKVEARRTAGRRVVAVSLVLAVLAAMAAEGLTAGAAGASPPPAAPSARGGVELHARPLDGLQLFRSRARSAHPTVPVGDGPFNSALDPATHTIYVTNSSSNTVSLLDSATCNALRTSGCGRTLPTVQVGNSPTGLAVDQATNTVYVANYGSNTVSVINGATCNAEKTSGCGRTPPTVTVGSGSDALDVNQETDTVYVANENGEAGGLGLGNTVSVIDGRTCNGQVSRGCSQTPPTVTVATGPEGVLTDQSTDTIYVGSVAPSGAETVSVIKGATCNATISFGCSQTPHTVTVGTGNPSVNVAFAIDQATKTLYVTNSISDTLSMIDKATCNATIIRGCSRTPNVVHVGNEPIAISLEAATGTVYVVHQEDDTVSALTPATCNAMDTSGCDAHSGFLRTGGGPYWVTTDRATDTIYVPNTYDGTVSVLNGATCNARVTSGCNRFSLPTAKLGSSPLAAVVDQATDTVYVANANDNTVSVVNGATCNAKVTSGCDRIAPTVTVGAFPIWAALDNATRTLYVANLGDNTVSVINAAKCNASVTSGCGQTPPTVEVGNKPDGLAIDQQTDSVYVANAADNTVSVIDGAKCNATVKSGCGRTPPTVTVGAQPGVPAVNEATDTIYVPNFGTDTVSVIDGAKCNASVQSGCGKARAIVTVGNNPNAVAVDPDSHTVYVANTNFSGNYSGSVSVINGATCNGHVTSGCGHMPPTATVGALPQTLAIDQATDRVFVANYFDASVSVIDGATCNATVKAGCAGTPATIPVGGLPFGPAVNEATGTVYVPNSADNNMSVFGFGCPNKSSASAHAPSSLLVEPVVVTRPL